MTAHKPKPTTAVLLQLDADLLAALDRFWPAVGHPSRRSAIRHAIEAMLAAHAAHLQRSHAVAAQPAGGFSSPDSTLEASSRPRTADLSL